MARHSGFGLASAGHFARAAGFNNISRVIRSSNSMGVGSQMGGAEMGAASAEAISGLSGIAAAAGPLALALGGVMIASKLVEVGFNAVADTVGTVAAAVAQIGGARGLQGMLLESASSERQAADIAANTADQVSKFAVMEMQKNLSTATEFSKQEIGEMARAFIGKRGNFGEFQQLGQFTANLASVGTLTPQQAGEVMGQLRTQFPELSMDQTKEAAMQLWAAGKQGAVELKDTTSITQALGFAHAVSPDALSGIGLEMGMVQAAQRFTGGQSADQAVTGIRRLQEQLLSDPNSKKGQALQQLLGADYLAHDESGRAVIRNAPNSMARIALGAYEDRPGFSQAFESRSMKAVRGFVTGEVGDELKGKTEKQKVSILEDMFKKMEETHSHLEEFNGALKVVSDTADYQLKQAFNKLANELEGQLVKLWPQLEVGVKAFTDYLVDHKEELGDSLTNLVSGLLQVGAALPVFADVAIAAMKLISEMILKLGDNTLVGLGFNPKMVADLHAAADYDPEVAKKDADKKIKEALITSQENNIDFLNWKPGAQSTPKTYEGLDKNTQEKNHQEAMTYQQKLLKIAQDTEVNTRKAPQPPPKPPEASTNGH